MSRHDCKYWQLNLKYHYRSCGFCGRMQYDYGGKWKDRITLEYFIEKYSSKREFNDLIISCGSYFEYHAYESWGGKIFVWIVTDPTNLDKGESYGPFPNLNCAEYEIDKSRREKQT